MRPDRFPVGSVLVVLWSILLELYQAGPPRVDRRLVCMVRVVGQSCATVDAQTRTVVLAQRLERQCKHHRIPQRRFEVEQVSLEPAGFVILRVVGGRA